MSDPTLEILTMIKENKEFLTSVREKAGLTVADMAAIVDVTKGTISRWETGKRALFENAGNETVSLRYLDKIKNLHTAQSKLFRFAQTMSSWVDENTTKLNTTTGAMSVMKIEGWRYDY